MVRGANRRREDTRRAQPSLLRLPTWAAVSDSGAVGQSAWYRPYPGRRMIESPPQAWGRRCSCRLGLGLVRITPTGVGPAPFEDTRRTGRPDHPHRRGAGCIAQLSRALPPGSPPQAWGRRRCDVPRLWAFRITPTGVGPAPPSDPANTALSDHPHRRGAGTEPHRILMRSSYSKRPRSLLSH
jgi:hypothetical protein